MIIICPECGKEISDQAMSCPHCGYPLCDNLDYCEDEGYFYNNNELSAVRRPFVFWALLTFLILQFIGVVLKLLLPTAYTMEFFLLIGELIAAPITLVLAIINIVYAKRNRTRYFPGIAGIILSGFFVILFFIVAIVMTPVQPTITLYNGVPEENLYAAAEYATEEIKSHLKSPSSFIANEVYVEVENNGTVVESNGEVIYDSGFIGFYDVYIDFTAQNGLGGVNRKIVCCTYNQDYDYYVPVLTWEELKSVDSIPKSNPYIYELDANIINNY